MQSDAERCVGGANTGADAIRNGSPIGVGARTFVLEESPWAQRLAALII